MCNASDTTMMLPATPTSRSNRRTRQFSSARGSLFQESNDNTFEFEWKTQKASRRCSADDVDAICDFSVRQDVEKEQSSPPLTSLVSMWSTPSSDKSSMRQQISLPQSSHLNPIINGNEADVKEEAHRRRMCHFGRWREKYAVHDVKYFWVW